MMLGLKGGVGFVAKLYSLPWSCSKDKESMGYQYIEVFKFHRTKMDWLEIVPSRITLPVDPKGKITGKVFVQFASQELREKALRKQKGRKGHRYTEVFKSSQEEVRPYSDPLKFMSGVYSTGYGGYEEYSSHHSSVGKDFSYCLSNMYDHRIWRKRLYCPDEISPDGRVTGEANIEFAIHKEVVPAITKDLANKQHRYIELFLNSTNGARSMGVSAQSTYSGLESQFVSHCYRAGYGGQNSMGGYD
ncbi:unnamed protein product [Nyctereutes procyonoides]|uniref:(raccoon dog) hypothetical protein n=1 Tax=Nyctereutes procyonoides TaxID=34880 RepID=A0A811YR32_NYCPR|nr:unnamed protein product [Nyctereutes procyonoides]